jgi:hypothetical protein
MSVGFDVLMGKAYLSDLKKPTEEELAEEERVKQEELERSVGSHSFPHGGAGQKKSSRRTREGRRTPIPFPSQLKLDKLPLLLLLSSPKPRQAIQLPLLLPPHLHLLSALQLHLLHLLQLP